MIGGDVVSCWCTVTICKKSPEWAAVAITAAKCQKIVTLHHAVLAVADFAMLFGILRHCLGALESLVFYVKKVAKRYKRLKDCQKWRPKTEETERCQQKTCCCSDCAESLKANG
jgi:hypothetical protein